MDVMNELNYEKVNELIREQTEEDQELIHVLAHRYFDELSETGVRGILAMFFALASLIKIEEASGE